MTYTVLDGMLNPTHSLTLLYTSKLFSNYLVQD